jgi:hypothetical protein
MERALSLPQCQGRTLLFNIKKIDTFLRSTINSERLNALAVLSMEKNFLSCHPEIKEKIVDLFAQIKTRRMDFIFK